MALRMIQLALSFMLLLTVSMVQAQEEVNPYQLLQDVAGKTFERIKVEQSKINQDPNQLRTIVEEELLPYVDYKFSGLKVLGKYYKNTPKQEVLEYLHVFRDYLITTYAVALGYYNEQVVEFEPVKDVGRDKVVTVRALVKEDGKPDIKVAFKVRKNSKTNQWKAYDMVAEGISLLSSKQTEFESILRQEGVAAVIDIMKKKIAAPIKLNDEKAA